jgi:hypothetical protein
MGGMSDDTRENVNVRRPPLPTIVVKVESVAKYHATDERAVYVYSETVPPVYESRTVVQTDGFK